MKAMNVVLALLAVLALALFIAIGGDGADNEAHAEWMAETKAAGTAVLW